MRDRNYMKSRFTPDMRLFIVLEDGLEHIIIDTEQNVNAWIQRRDIKLFSGPESNPIGTWLLNLPTQVDDGWMKAIDTLYEAAHYMHTQYKDPKKFFKELTAKKSTVKKLEDQIGGGFFEDKRVGTNKISSYIALAIWEEYKTAREDPTFAQMVDLVSKAKNMVRPLTTQSRFHVGKSQKITQQSKIWDWGPPRNDYDFGHHIVTPEGTQVSYIRLDWSLLPAKVFTLAEMDAQKLCVNICKVCGKAFLAPNLRPKMCSDACRKNATQQNAMILKSDSTHEYVKALANKKPQYWRNNIKKMENSPDWSSAEVEVIKAEFDKFKADKNRKNTQYRHGKISLKQLEDWYFEQERFLLSLMYPER